MKKIINTGSFDGMPTWREENAEETLLRIMNEERALKVVVPNGQDDFDVEMDDTSLEDVRESNRQDNQLISSMHW